nr:LysM domain-containing protein [Endozoicomonas sp.]
MGFIRNTLIFLSLLLALAFQALANWSSEELQTRKHLVRPQETLEVIAGSYGFEVNELARYNKLDITQELRVGQVIYFPSDIVRDQPGLPSADQVNPLDARRFPNAVGTTVEEERSRLMPLLDGEQFSGKESDLSRYDSRVHYAASSDYDYNLSLIHI